MDALNVIWTFFKIGVIAFGGGWSVVGIIKNSIVPLWLSEERFRALIAIAQSTPGPVALNAATMIGWTQGGIFTAMAATLSVVAFPVLAIALTTVAASKISIKKGPLDESLRTGSLAMMLMTLWVLRPVSLDPLLLLFALGAFAVSAFTKVNVLWTILGSGAINWLLGPTIRGLLGIKG